MDRQNIAKIIKINDVWLPGIAQYQVDMEDLDGEGTMRDEIGVMHREVIRAKVKKLMVVCTQDNPEVLAVAELVGTPTFEAEVLCPGAPGAEEGYIKGVFYASKISTKLLKLESSGKSYWTVSFNAVEV